MVVGEFSLMRCPTNTLQEKAYMYKSKGYNPTITASRHLMGKDSFIISLAVSINLQRYKILC